MTRSNFDPSNPDSQRTGRGGLDRFLGPEAGRGSQIPGELVDGKENEEDAPEDINLSHEALPPEEAARRLDEMQSGQTSVEDLPPGDGPVE